jgi:hypothetical protein
MLMARVAVLASLILLYVVTPALAASSPTVTDAKDGIFGAFQTHPLVGIAEAHGLAQELDFYSALIRDPRFASGVGNVVLEVGDAAYQDVVDRYVNGENVPYVELRKVWADTVGFSPTVDSVGSVNIYNTIRTVNMTLPPDKRIKVWLGDPPIDWSKIKTKADLAPLGNERDSYPASLIDRILANNKKALVIYGAGHLQPAFTDQNTLLALVSRTHPGALFIVWPYLGYATEACAEPFEAHIKDWPTPALIQFRGSSLEADMLRPGCGIISRPSSMTEDQYGKLMRDYVGLTSDALLYLGQRSQQVCSPAMPDIYLDLDFRSELERRHEIRSGKPIAGFIAQENTATPKPFWPSGQCTFAP